LRGGRERAATGREKGEKVDHTYLVSARWGHLSAGKRRREINDVSSSLRDEKEGRSVIFFDRAGKGDGVELFMG